MLLLVGLRDNGADPEAHLPVLQYGVHVCYLDHFDCLSQLVVLPGRAISEGCSASNHKANLRRELTEAAVGADAANVHGALQYTEEDQ